MVCCGWYLLSVPNDTLIKTSLTGLIDSHGLCGTDGHVGQCDHFDPAGNAYLELRLHGWLVEARKSLSSVRRLKLSAGHPSATCSTRRSWHMRLQSADLEVSRIVGLGSVRVQ